MLIAKAILVALYLAAGLSLLVPLLGPADVYLQYTALALLVIHTLELAFAWEYLKRHPGGMVQSVLLCLLFGIAHWGPLKKQAA